MCGCISKGLALKSMTTALFQLPVMLDKSNIRATSVPISIRKEYKIVSSGGREEPTQLSCYLKLLRRPL
jgi:hypothetical protein